MPSWFKGLFKGWPSGELFAHGSSPGGQCLVVPPFLIPTWQYQRCCTVTCVEGKIPLPSVEQQSASECSGSAAERLKAAQAMAAPAGSQLCLKCLGVKKSQAHWLSLMAGQFMDTSAVERKVGCCFRWLPAPTTCLQHDHLKRKLWCTGVFPCVSKHT